MKNTVLEDETTHTFDVLSKKLFFLRLGHLTLHRFRRFLKDELHQCCGEQFKLLSIIDLLF
jgi:hypothetical protein